MLNTLALAIINRLLRFKLFNLLLYIPEFRDFLVKLRFKVFTKRGKIIFGDLHVGNSSNVFRHNFDVRRMFYPGLSKRPDLIAKPMSSLNVINQNASSMKILLIGARTEAEIMAFGLCGFKEQNIFAIDLASYSENISIMDARNLEFPSGFFDVIVIGWVLEFVTDIDKVKSEIRRCLKNHGILAVGSMFHPETQDMNQYAEIKEHSDRKWFPKEVKYIEEYFEFKDVYFSSDIWREDRDKRGELIIIGTIN